MAYPIGASCPVKPGVLVGDDLITLFQWAKDKNFAIPAVNCATFFLARPREATDCVHACQRA